MCLFWSSRVAGEYIGSWESCGVIVVCMVTWLFVVYPVWDAFPFVGLFLLGRLWFCFRGIGLLFLLVFRMSFTPAQLTRVVVL